MGIACQKENNNLNFVNTYNSIHLLSFFLTLKECITISSDKAFLAKKENLFEDEEISPGWSALLFFGVSISKGAVLLFQRQIL